jgi:hypothetical protein
VSARKEIGGGRLRTLLTDLAFGTVSVKIWQFYQEKKTGIWLKTQCRKNPPELMLVVPRRKPIPSAAATDPVQGIQAIARATPQREQLRLAENLCTEWARRDINRLWNAIACSSLHPELKQHMFTMLWN